MRTRFVWPLMAALTAAACGSDATDPALTGTFEVFVSGEFSQQLEGTAEFGIFAGEGFGMSLLPRTGASTLGIGHRLEARPAVGTHSIDAPDADAFFGLYIQQLQQGVATFISRSGEMVITSSSATRLEGSFDFVARGSIPGDPFEREVRVEGTFSATCARGARCD